MLRSLLAKISDSTAELTNMIVEYKLAIIEHYDSMRLKVDIKRETILENIHKEYNQLMSEIDAYERKHLSDWTEIKESTENVVEDVSNRMRAFVAEQQAYLQSGQASVTYSRFVFLHTFTNLSKTLYLLN